MLKLKIAFLFFTFILSSATPIHAQGSGGLEFNGIDNYVEIEDSPLNTIATGDFTLEAWIQGKEADQNTHPVILSNRGASAFGGGILLFLHDIWRESRTKMLCFQVNATNYLFVNNGSFNGSLLDGECHHVAVTRDGSNLSLFIDGGWIGSKTIPNPSAINLNSPLWIGKDRATNNTFNGLISQCRIWNRAKTELQIIESQDMRLEGNEAGLVAYWEMNDQDGQIVTDKTGVFDGILGSTDGIDNQDPVWSEEQCIISSSGNPINCSFAFAPNPTEGLVTIQQEVPATTTLRVINSIGQLVATFPVDQTSLELDLSLYPAGVYFLQVQVGDCVFSERVVKVGDGL